MKNIKKRADDYYCRYLKMMQENEQLGSEAKIETGKFTTKALAGHVNAGVLLGKHMAYMSIVNNPADIIEAFRDMCMESISPDLATALEDEIIPSLKANRHIN